MKDLNLREAFCEIISGAAVIGVALLCIDLAGTIDLKEEIRAGVTVDLASVSLFFVSCYFAGLIVDALGLAIGELFFDNLMASQDPPSDAAVKAFWKEAADHVVKYRSNQWTFYSAYRNLFLLLIPGAILGAIVISDDLCAIWVVAFVIAALLVEVSLFFTLRSLINLYYRITISFV